MAPIKSEESSKATIDPFILFAVLFIFPLADINIYFWEFQNKAAVSSHESLRAFEVEGSQTSWVALTF